MSILDALSDAFASIRRAAPPPPTNGPRPGDIVVYGWDDKNNDGQRGPGEIGHVGILSFVPGVIYSSWIVDEARKWIGQGIYGLGKGGRRPQDGTPLDADGRCDCSGFVCHCLRIDRLDTETNQWWNTDSIKRDGAKVGGRFDPVPMSVDLRKCRAIHCHGGRAPAITETFATPWYARGSIVRFNAPLPV